MEKTKPEIDFLKDNLEKQLRIYHRYEVRANYTLALASGTLVFVIGQSIARPDFGFSLYIIAAASFICLILSLLTIKPPKSMRKQRQPESLFYHNYIDSLNFKEFHQRIKKTLDSPEEIAKQYSLEIYNLANYSIQPRKYFFRYIPYIYALGLGLGTILILIKAL